MGAHACNLTEGVAQVKPVIVKVVGDEVGDVALQDKSCPLVLECFHSRLQRERWVKRNPEASEDAEDQEHDRVRERNAVHLAKVLDHPAAN